MLLTRMRPEQVREAVKLELPLVMGAGVVEYHGPHLPIGTDMMIADYIAREVEKRCSCVLAPPITYGPTMSWAAGPEDGEIDFDPEPFFGYVKEMLKRFWMIGFKHIYVIQHHQGPEGLQSLSLRSAAMQLIREETLRWGNGWGRLDVEDLPNTAIFQAIQVAGIDSFLQYPAGSRERMPIGHAGKGETQLIQHIDPETVRMESLKSLDHLPEWLLDAKDASPAEGKLWLDRCVEGWVRTVSGGKG